ncbi:Prenylated rab acceptor 1 [Madurella fahalii]|uniref:Prenylated rab acceptor 1 n=1 Tax=Madurella fahalii TaxID=1157608 RepID=A0ABQ0FZ64_9PEZI
MGMLDDAASVISARTSHSKRSKSHRSSRHHRSRSRSRSRSRHRHSHGAHSTTGGGGGGGGGITGMAASFFGGGGSSESDSDRRRRRGHRSRHDHDDKRSSFFSLPNVSTRSFFSGFGGGGSGTSHYKRSPRPGFVARALRKLKRLLRDLVYYAKRHPVKVFMLVIMPLVTTGALTALLARFGLRLPPFVERMLGVAAKAGAGDSAGLVGEAVRLVKNGVGSGSNVTRSSAFVERGRDGNMQWERRTVEKDFLGRGAGGWGGGWKGIAKMFS